MNQANVKVSFYLKKSEADAKGNCPVMARLIVGKYSETAFSVKLRVPQSLWLSGRACGKSAAARDIITGWMKYVQLLSVSMRNNPQTVKLLLQKK